MSVVRDSHGSDPAPNASVPYRAELVRKALHVATALLVPFFMLHVEEHVITPLLALGAIVGVGADGMRAWHPGVHRFIRHVFGSIMRPEELPAVGDGWSMNGATSVLVGAALLALLFPMSLAAAVLASTLVADAAAALIGRQWGRHLWPGTQHTLEGSLAFLGAGTVVWALASSAPAYAGLPGLLAAACIEALPLPINDNISVPLAAAAVLSALGIGMG